MPIPVDSQYPSDRRKPIDGQGDHCQPARAGHAPDAPAAVGPYVHAVRAGGLLFFSGQVPLDPATGELVEGTPAEQAGRCLENLAAVCAAAGAEPRDAVRMTIYLTDMGAFATSTRSTGRSSRPSRPPGSRSASPRCRSGAKVEIDAVVALGARLTADRGRRARRSCRRRAAVERLVAADPGALLAHALRARRRRRSR